MFPETTINSEEQKEVNPEIVKYLNTNNWFNFETFYDYITKQPFFKFAEVGVWKGHSIAYLAKKLIEKSIAFELFAIDPWDGKIDVTTVTDFEKEHLYEIYEEYLKSMNVREQIKDIKMVSLDAVKLFKNSYFDFILIDANHQEEMVTADVTAWWPKLKKNGILACHDYVKHCGVYPAINKMIESRKINGQHFVMNDMFYIIKSR